ncbi:Ger(x)C family spore germination protein [Paenibacillus glycanilyticus]|uniref:Ger(x)C family spore germination protein n=1 Tax=Paenibacillus glycanilyticus TaxID=126569 RepID=UPI00203AF442|nr:Ger(x)C family spore germination protein [Paenibacillus glycanilyticus]MCM3630819.1 Ger(x)C family spore germination protein [Paenibacillus glycanilyticus]
MSIRMKSVLGAVLLIFFAMITTGCWNRIELNEVAITSATGVDWDGENWIVSYQVLIPAAISSVMGGSGGGGPKSPIIVYSTKGRTIRDAIMHSYSESPRKLFFAHNRVVVIGEKALQRGVNELIDVYFRNSSTRETVSVLATPGTARRILEQFMQLQAISGAGMKEIILSEMKNTSILPNIPVYQLAMEVTGDAKSAVVPEIFVSGKEDTSSLESFGTTSIPSKLKLGRLAVLKGDKMIGWMNRKESLGAAYLRDSVQQSYIVVPCEDDKGNTGFNTIHILKSSTKVIPKLKGKQLAFTADVQVTGTLMESNCAQDLYKPGVIQSLEQGGQQQVGILLQEAWAKGQQMNTDIFGAAEKTHRKFPKQWKEWSKNWEEVFKEAPLETKVKFRMARMGLSNKSFRYLMDKKEK